MGVSAVTTSVGAGAQMLEFMTGWLTSISVFVGILVSIVVIVVQLCTMMRQNREHRAMMIKTELEIELLRSKGNDL